MNMCASLFSINILVVELMDDDSPEFACTKTGATAVSVMAQQTCAVGPTLVYCWASVVDGGPAVNQCWANVSCLLGADGP